MPEALPGRRRTAFWAAFALLAVGYLSSRLINLTRLPVFIDEAVLIQYSRQAIGGNTLTAAMDGRWLPPMIMIPFRFLATNTLEGARLASAVVGLSALLACLLTGRMLFGERDALLAGLIYTIIPFALFYERMALADVYVAAFGAWCLYLSIALVESDRPIMQALLCIVICAAILSKTSGVQVLAIPLLVCAVFVDSGRRMAYLRRVLPAIVAAVLLFGFVMLSGYGSWQILEKRSFQVADLPSMLSLNLRRARVWFTILLTPALALLGLAASLGWIAWCIRRGPRGEVLLVTVWLALVLPYVLFGTFWYSRYLLLSVPPLALLVGRSIGVLGSKLGQWVLHGAVRLRPVVLVCLLLVLLARPIGNDLTIIGDPKNSALPPVDTLQYVSGWPSGYGLPELASFLRQQAARAPINVARFSYADPAHQGLDVYLSASDRMRLVAIDPSAANAMEQIDELAHERRTLFVSNPDRELQDGIVAESYLGETTLVWSYTKPHAGSTLEVWDLSRVLSLERAPSGHQ
jgi:Dolichyl-phosphate-mannose-protein mannosyltransferase